MGLIEFLDAFPESEDRPLRYSAMSELSGISQPEADELALTWDEWTPARRLELLSRLASLQEEHADLEFEVVFKKGLALGDPRCRRESLLGLTDSQDRTVAQALASLIASDSDASVRSAAAQAASGMVSLAIEGRLHERDGERLFSALKGALHREDETTEVRLRALESIAYFGRRRAGRYIEAACADTEPAATRSVLIAMGRTSDPHWLPSVVSCLDHFNPGVRYEAARALGEIGGEEHAHSLAQLLDDQDLDVQSAAVASLAMLGGSEAMRLLAGARNSPEPEIAGAAREALSMLATEENLVEDRLQDIHASGMIPGITTGTDDGYDAAEREGWAHLLERDGD